MQQEVKEQEGFDGRPRLEAESAPSNQRIGHIYQVTKQLSGIKAQVNKGNNKITELRTILQRESQNS